jgi:hypothetical protein
VPIIPYIWFQHPAPSRSAATQSLTLYALLLGRRRSRRPAVQRKVCTHSAWCEKRENKEKWISWKHEGVRRCVVIIAEGLRALFRVRVIVDLPRQVSGSKGLDVPIPKAWMIQIRTTYTIYFSKSERITKCLGRNTSRMNPLTISLGFNLTGAVTEWPPKCIQCLHIQGVDDSLRGPCRVESIPRLVSTYDSTLNWLLYR